MIPLIVNLMYANENKILKILMGAFIDSYVNWLLHLSYYVIPKDGPFFLELFHQFKNVELYIVLLCKAP